MTSRCAASSRACPLPDHTLRLRPPGEPRKGLNPMDIFGTILFPIKWVIEAILVGFHTLLTALGMDAGRRHHLGAVDRRPRARRARRAHPDLRAADQEPAQDARGRAAAEEDPGQVPGQEGPVLPRGDAARDHGAVPQGRHQPVQLVPAAADPDADLLQPLLGAERGQGRRRRQLQGRRRVPHRGAEPSSSAARRCSTSRRSSTASSRRSRPTRRRSSSSSSPP